MIELRWVYVDLTKSPYGPPQGSIHLGNNIYQKLQYTTDLVEWKDVPHHGMEKKEEKNNDSI